MATFSEFKDSCPADMQVKGGAPERLLCDWFFVNRPLYKSDASSHFAEVGMLLIFTARVLNESGGAGNRCSPSPWLLWCLIETADYAR